MDVLAPKDGFVISLAVAQGATVDAGAIVAQMDTTEEDLRLARLAAIDTLRGTLARRLMPPSLDLTRRLAQISVDIAKEQKKFAIRTMTEIANTALTGREVPIGLDTDRELAVIIAPLQIESAETNLEMFNYALNEASTINAIISDHIQQEIRAVQAQRSILSLKALNRGTVRLNVAAGSFVSKGTVLFDVQP